MSTPASSSATTTPHKPCPSSANTKSNRLPAPTLFVGPPSHNASQISIARPDSNNPTGAASHPSTLAPNAAAGTTQAGKPARDPLHRHRSTLSRSTTAGSIDNSHTTSAPSGGPANPNPHAGQALPTLQKPSDKTVEAKWRGMRLALDEVGQTAQTSTHVFGPLHAEALDELRKAQIELARAWGRGNQAGTAGGSVGGDGSENGPEGASGQAGTEGGGVGGVGGASGQATQQIGGQRRGRGDTVSSASTALSDESTFSDDTVRTGVSARLEEETAQDIRLAGERRAANEAYFAQVDRGVRDVVARLEAVAVAMRGVESESRSLWSLSTRSSGEEEGASLQESG